MKLPKGIKAGDVVTAKRSGWNEQLTAVQEFDMEPYADKGYASDDLRGPLTIVEVPGFTGYLVGGQEADPATIRAEGAGGKRGDEG